VGFNYNLYYITYCNIVNLAKHFGEEIGCFTDEEEWQKIKEELTCVVYLDIFHDPKTIQTCFHTYCKHCLETMIRIADFCPICRQPLPDDISFIPTNSTICRLIGVYKDRHSNYMKGRNYWKDIETEITCFICYDNFTDPKTLPCLHTFCMRCIELCIKTGMDDCPLCRLPLPHLEISSLPTNFMMIHLGEIYQIKERKLVRCEDKQRKDLITCGNCKENLLATAWCVMCDNPLCGNCDSMHYHNTVFIIEFFRKLVYKLHLIQL